MLEESALPISEIAVALGYSEPSHFTRGGHQHQLRSFEHVHATKALRVRPNVDRLPPCSGGQRMKTFDVVFMRMLGVDAFSGGEMETPAQHLHRLLDLAHKVNIDAAVIGV